MEEVPVLGEFIVGSAERDINDFNTYSPVFTIDYLASIKDKINVCNELVKSSTVTKEMKAVTQQLVNKSKSLRTNLNTLEGYLKLGANDLDIAVKDVDLKSVRLSITRRNTEGLISNMRTVLIPIKRNLQILVAQGLKMNLLNDIESRLQEISALNTKQNELISKRNRLTDTNIEKFNELWESFQPILNAAKAIYRSADKVKLKDYTISQLKKRINAKS
jgi:hypothetical protein